MRGGGAWGGGAHGEEREGLGAGLARALSIKVGGKGPGLAQGLSIMGCDPQPTTGGKIPQQHGEQGVITEVVFAVITAEQQRPSGTINH